MICHYCGADHAEDIVCQPMRQVMDDARAGSERPSSSEEQVTKQAGDVFGSGKEKLHEGPNVLAMQVASLRAIYDAYRTNDASSMEVCATLQRIDMEALLKAAQSARGALPKEPPVELLVSMALRVNHGFGLDDERSKEVQLSDMRKVYEEVSGYGFYSDAVKDRYTAMLGVSSDSESVQR